MIKVNLLPSYIAEFRRMKLWGIIFAVLFLLEAGVVLGWQDGLKKQTEWFGKDKTRCDKLKTDYLDYKKKADDLKANSITYNPWLDLFWGLQPVKDYNEGIRKSMIEAATRLGGDGSAYSTMTLSTTGEIEARGKIKGSLKFLDYYFRMSDQKFSLDPAVKVENPLTQTVELHVKGTVAALPQLPKSPDGGAQWEALFQAAGAAASGGAPGTTPPPPAGGGPPGPVPGQP